MRGPPRWTAGITTVPQRRESLLPKTISSLKAAGFHELRLFVDGCRDTGDWEDEFQLPVTARTTPVRAFGNWILALAELLIRSPDCQRYALFQDDLVTSRNLKHYIDSCFRGDTFPQRQYLNLLTWPANQKHATPDPRRQRSQATGWFKAVHHGYGAVGLVFDRLGVFSLLANPTTARKPAGLPPRSWANIDGAVWQSLVGSAPDCERYVELVHSPSLVDHIGRDSTLVKWQRNMWLDKVVGFRGETFDAMNFASETV